MSDDHHSDNVERALDVLWDGADCDVNQTEVIDILAAADLPLIDRDRGVAVIRLDPEKAAWLRSLACPAGQPWTGDDPSTDHGHTTCWVLHQLARILDGELVDDDG